MIPEIESKDTLEIKSFQEQKLQELIVYLNENSPYYKALFLRENINIQEIKTLSDLESIPTTSKNDLQLHNDDFFCVPMHEIIDYATTSGTLVTLLLLG